MSMRSEWGKSLVNILFDRIAEAADDGVSKNDLAEIVMRSGYSMDFHHAMVAVGYLIREIRKTLWDEVLVYDRKQKVYRFAINRKDAQDWRRWRCLVQRQCIMNLREYAQAEGRKFGEPTEEHQAVAWRRLEETLRRAEYDIDDAARMSFGV